MLVVSEESRVTRISIPRPCPFIQTGDTSTSPAFADVYNNLDVEVWASSVCMEGK